MEVIIKTVDAIAFYSDAASLARNLGFLDLPLVNGVSSFQRSLPGGF
jgi:hypothetical protein